MSPGSDFEWGIAGAGERSWKQKQQQEDGRRAARVGGPAPSLGFLEALQGAGLFSHRGGPFRLLRHTLAFGPCVFLVGQ